MSTVSERPLSDATRVRVPGPGMVDWRILAIALVVASPALWRLSQGMLSVTDVLVRYLMVAVGCVVVAALVRVVWPVLAGTVSAAAGAASPDLAAFEQLVDLAEQAGLGPEDVDHGPGAAGGPVGAPDVPALPALDASLDPSLDPGADPATQLLGAFDDGDLVELSTGPQAPR